MTGGYFFLWSSKYMIKSSTKLTIDIYSVALAIKSPYVSMLSIPPS